MNNPIQFHELIKLSEAAKQALLKRTESDLGRYIESVEPILKAVKEEGDQALVRFAREFDRAELEPDSIKVRSKEFERAFESVADDVIEAISFAAESIRIFHEGQMPAHANERNSPRGLLRRKDESDTIGGLLCAPRKGFFSQRGADDNHSCSGGGSPQSLHPDSARTGRQGG